MRRKRERGKGRKINRERKDQNLSGSFWLSRTNKKNGSSITHASNLLKGYILQTSELGRRRGSEHAMTPTGNGSLGKGRCCQSLKTGGQEGKLSSGLGGSPSKGIKRDPIPPHPQKKKTSAEEKTNKKRGHTPKVR